jgi:hypothetical protein
MTTKIPCSRCDLGLIVNPENYHVCYWTQELLVAWALLEGRKGSLDDGVRINRLPLTQASYLGFK